MPKYFVEIGNSKDLKTWNKLVDQSKMGTVFHKLDWLHAIKSECNIDLLPMIGYKGTKKILLLPLFKKSIMGFKFAFSPPPRCFIPDMGLIFLCDSPKQSRIEKDYSRIMNAMNEFLNNKFDLINITNSTKLYDIRPFTWNGYKVINKYTYFIDLQKEPDQLFYSFNNKLRNQLRRGNSNQNINIKFVNNKNYFNIIFSSVFQRYSSQNSKIKLSRPYINNIWNNYKRNITLAIARDNRTKEYISGLILLKSKDKIMAWQGGVYNKKYPYINDLLHWESVKYMAGKGYKYYDMVGANIAHISKYKSKFNPFLKVYYQVEKSNLKGKLAKIMYKKMINGNA